MMVAVLVAVVVMLYSIGRSILGQPRMRSQGSELVGYTSRKHILHMFACSWLRAFGRLLACLRARLLGPLLGYMVVCVPVCLFDVIKLRVLAQPACFFIVRGFSLSKPSATFIYQFMFRPLAWRVINAHMSASNSTIESAVSQFHQCSSIFILLFVFISVKVLWKSRG